MLISLKPWPLLIIKLFPGPWCLLSLVLSLYTHSCLFLILRSFLFSFSFTEITALLFLFMVFLLPTSFPVCLFLFYSISACHPSLFTVVLLLFVSAAFLYCVGCSLDVWRLCLSLPLSHSPYPGGLPWGVTPTGKRSAGYPIWLNHVWEMLPFVFAMIFIFWLTASFFFISFVDIFIHVDYILFSTVCWIALFAHYWNGVEFVWQEFLGAQQPALFSLLCMCMQYN